MNKKQYDKPTCNVVELTQRACLLAGSPTPPESPGFGDWLG